MPARQIVFLVTALCAVGCSQDASTPAREELQAKQGRAGAQLDVANVEMAPAPPPMAPSAVRSTAPMSEPGMASAEQLPTASIAPTMVIRTGDARIKVTSVDTAIAQLQALAQRVGGYVANSSIQGGENELRQATLELKIPAARFGDAQNGLNALGKVEYVNVMAQDVGEEFVDVTARMENSRRLEQRLVGLLATRTGKLEEVLSVERELARVREMIERYEGRLRYLRTRSEVSTLSVTVHESEPIVGTRGSSNRIVEAFKTAWRNFVGFIAGLIEFLGVLIPLAIIAIPLGRWAWRNRPRGAVPPPRPPTEPLP
jgi:hypothetical protein